MTRAGKRVAGYIRVSTEEQIDGHSLEAQRREIEKYAAHHQLSLVGIYADEGVSAHTDRVDRRPQLAALLSDARAGAFETVVVHTIDRWARNIRVQTEALQQLGSAGVGFVSLTENIDFSTPSGKLMLTMIGGFSEFFSDQLAVHVLKAQRLRAESGLPVGPVPFGYVKRAGSAAEIHEDEGPAVREAFAARAAGRSNGEIAAELNRRGFRTRTGQLFTAHALKDLFNCRFYVGVVTFQGQEFAGLHEPLVSQDLFELAQARRTPRGPHSRTSHKTRGVLAGRIRCVRCGSALHAERGHQDRPMYRERHGRECDTNRRSFMAAPVDAQIAEIFRSIELAPDWRDRIVEHALASPERSVGSLKDARRRLVRAYADGGFTLAEYEARLAAVDAEIRYAADTIPVEASEVAALLDDLPALWGEATPDEQRQLLASVVDRVYVDVEAKRITGLVPVPGLRALLESGVRRAAEASAALLSCHSRSEERDLGVGGDGGELNSPSSEPSSRIYYGCSQRLISLRVLHWPGATQPVSVVLAAWA